MRIRFHALKKRMTCRSLCGSFLLLFLLVTCTVLWVLHSLYFILRYEGDSYKEEKRTTDYQQLSIPAIVVCNRFPFTQDGVNGINTAFRQEQVLRYLREWTNPSMRESADYFPPNTQNYYDVGVQTTAQYLPQFSRRNSIQSMIYQCQSVVNSCSYRGVTMTSFQCCQNVQSFVPTLNGLCFVYKDRSLVQNQTGVDNQFVMTFQMSRNSYQGLGLQTHPGLDVYLLENGDDIIRIGHEVEAPITLTDKEGVRLKMHMERRADIRRSTCGTSVDGAESSDKTARSANRTNLFPCILLTATQVCGCHPLISELLPINSSAQWYFTLLTNTTSACTVPQFDACVRPFLAYARPPAWEEPIPNVNGSEALKKCFHDNHRSCLMTSYPGTLDRYALPNEYTTSGDFISRLSLEFDSMRVTEVLVSKDPNLYETLSYIGYNIALWFTIGHIFWSLFTASRDACCNPRRIAPQQSSFVAAKIETPTSRRSIPVEKPAEIVEET